MNKKFRAKILNALEIKYTTNDILNDKSFYDKIFEKFKFLKQKNLNISLDINETIALVRAITHYQVDTANFNYTDLSCNGDYPHVVLPLRDLCKKIHYNIKNNAISLTLNGLEVAYLIILLCGFDNLRDVYEDDFFLEELDEEEKLNVMLNKEEYNRVCKCSNNIIDKLSVLSNEGFDATTFDYCCLLDIWVMTQEYADKNFVHRNIQSFEEYYHKLQLHINKDL